MNTRKSTQGAFKAALLSGCVAAMSLAIASPSLAQPAAPATPAAPQPWFGLKLPPPTNDPAKPVLQFEDAHLPVQPAVFGPGPKSPLLAPPRMRADLIKIVDFSLRSKAQGDFRWGRIVGTPLHHETVGWLVDQLKEAGVPNAKLEEYPGVLSIPTAAEVRIFGSPAFGPGSADVVLDTADTEGRGPVNGTVTGPLVYVGHATEADLTGRDIKGKIAVMHTTPSPGMLASDDFRRERNLITGGASGVINIMEAAGNLKSYTPLGGCGDKMCFSVGGQDGFFLENALGKAGQAGQEMRAKISATAELKKITGANGYAVIPGKKSRSAIVLNMHADAWYNGADDNGSGLVVGLALARYFAKTPLDHDLVFLIDGGHHTQPGIPEFRKAHAGVLENASLIINLEHVAAAGMTRGFAQPADNNFQHRYVLSTTEYPKEVSVSNMSPFLIDVWRKASSCFMIPLERVVDDNAPGEPSTMRDLLKKIPVTQMTEYNPLYHTSGEDVTSVTDEGLERAARFFAYMIMQADKASPELLQGAPYAATKGCPKIP